ncbi:MAG: hypothetical protein K1X95_00130 [Acidimicrobiia bacterium]|nr:hypothetical protein [Acidimicrobiia bacterium]
MSRGRAAAGLALGLAAVFAAAACGAAPDGRLGAEPVTTTTKPGTPVEVINTTTTAASTLVQPAPTNRSGSPPPSSSSSSSPSSPSSKSSSGSGGDASIDAMVDCLRTKGIAVPSPNVDSGGRVSYDEAALAQLAQDPAVQKAAEQCSAELGTAR